MSSYRGELARHAGSPDSPVERIVVTAVRTGAEATIRYDLIGDMDEVAIADPAPSERRDGLWTATCLEFFARHPGEDAYLEWNFAPSTAWAAYRFDGYRAGMQNADVAPPRIVTRATEGGYTLEATIAIAPGAWQVGLSAVIRDRDGGTSYWALAHPPGKADFHHADCFAAELAPSTGA